VETIVEIECQRVIVREREREREWVNEEEETHGKVFNLGSVCFAADAASLPCQSLLSVVRAPTPIYQFIRRNRLRRRITINGNAITTIIFIILIYVHHNNNNIDLFLHHGIQYIG